VPVQDKNASRPLFLSVKSDTMMTTKNLTCCQNQIYTPYRLYHLCRSEYGNPLHRLDSQTFCTAAADAADAAAAAAGC
jgi:hypothetical protein